MTIISCIKQVHDLDMVLAKDWLIQEDGKSIDISYANRIMNTYDETALELMLRLADVDDTIKTCVITIGNQSKDPIIRKALAVGVEEGIRVDEDTTLKPTPSRIAGLLASVITDSHDVQLVLCGRQADNYNHGLTGQLLAMELGWPCFTMVSEISYEKGLYHLERLVKGGTEHMSVKGPMVVTVTQSENKFLRMATLRNTMAAKNEEIKVITPILSTKKEKDYLDIVNLSVNKPTKTCKYLEDLPELDIQGQLERLLSEHSMNRGNQG